MYSASTLERETENYRNEGRYELIINDDVDMAILVHQMARIWQKKNNCHPFSIEYVYKILHQANYNRKKAIRLLESDDFNFLEMCDPPTRKYQNKWRPGDKRGHISESPFPNVQMLSDYLTGIVETKMESTFEDKRLLIFIQK